MESPQAAPLLRLSAYLVINISRLYSPGSGADGWSALSGEGDAGRYDFGGICRKILEGEEVLLSGAQGLFERQRVALHAALPLNNSSAS